MEASNMKAMREALAAINCIDTRRLKYLLCELVEADIFDGGQINKTISAVEKARRALAAPPRNCDVGTIDNQIARHHEYCSSRLGDDGKYPHSCGHTSCSECVLRWSQMEYKEEGK